jgi:hypothetical protein
MGRGVIGWLGVGVCVVVGSACVSGARVAFDIPAKEAPNLGFSTVRTLDGEVESVPDQWVAEVIPVDPPGELWVGWPRKQRVTREDFVRFDNSGGIEVIQPLRSVLQDSRDEPLPPPVPYGAPALWLEDQRGRVVEIPLVPIQRVHVRSLGDRGGADTDSPPSSGMSGGAIAGIVVGASLGGLALVAALFGGVFGAMASGMK